MTPVSSALASFLFSREPGAFFYTALRTAADRDSYLFTQPKRMLICSAIAKSASFFEKLGQAAARGYQAAGFCAYEMGFAFERDAFAAERRKKRSVPYAAFMLFDRSARVMPQDVASCCRQYVSGPAPYVMTGLTPSWDAATYRRTFDAVRRYLRNGDTYQINCCFTLQGNFYGGGAPLFLDLLKNQTVSYAVFMRCSGREIISLSPELFFRRQGSRITMQPMKGTLLRASRGSTRGLSAFRRCTKNRAENLMIVDMIRNDLSRIARKGSVHVPALYQLEAYETLYQMTSKITARLKKRVSYGEIFRSLFPSASVTGAPKIRSMQIIRELEGADRGIYTGALGFIKDRGDHAVFNIPIRTLVHDMKKRTLSMGIGSGVVIDSTARGEYQECIGKARFVRPYEKSFGLIETLRVDPQRRIFLFERHLARLRASAAYFRIPYDRTKIVLLLKKYLHTLSAHSRYRLRVVLSADGSCSISSVPLAATNRSGVRIVVSHKRLDSRNAFLRHKTTNRGLYDTEYARWQKKGYDEVIFCNERGEVCEGAISNIFVLRNGIWYTPPVRCGVLAGVYRNHLLFRYPERYREKVLRCGDLQKAEQIFICNSVRKKRLVSCVSVFEKGSRFQHFAI